MMVNRQNIIAFILGMLVMLPVGAYGGTLIVKAVNTPVLVDGQKINTSVYSVNSKTCTAVDAIAKAMGGTVTAKSGKLYVETPKTDLEKVAAACKNSCVMIYVYQDDKQIGQGSGWAYNGYIITAKHVADAGNRYTIFTDDSEYGVSAARVPISTSLDVAVLKADIKLPSVKLGDSDKLREGQKLVSITSPKGIQNAIDECINSGFAYVDTGKYLTTSESIMNSGSSGGAVFDSSSGVVAMAIEGQGDVNYAIPINDIKVILEKLK